MLFYGGRERIRTAVQGFADLCLATRPRDHFNSECKCREIWFSSKNGAVVFCEIGEYFLDKWTFYVKINVRFFLIF